MSICGAARAVRLGRRVVAGPDAKSFANELAGVFHCLLLSIATLTKRHDPKKDEVDSTGAREDR